MKKRNFILPAAVAVIFVLLSSIFVVDERERALVLQFGQIKAVKAEPGLGFKIPFIQEVVKYDDRILSLDTPEIEVTPSDDRRLIVDAFARFRIADVVQFRQAVGVGGVRAAEDRLASILNAQIREILGADQVTSNTILSSERASLMNRIRDNAQRSAQNLGIDVVDVRLKQTNLPDQNLDATFARMRAEREREAADEIARGEEAAQRVRAQADRSVVELTSEASREADITRGEADARRNRVFAEAFGQDQEFFEFYRSLTAYTRSLQGSNSMLVITPDSAFFDYLSDPNGRALGPVRSDPVVPQATQDAAAAQAAEDTAVAGPEAAEEIEGEGDVSVPAVQSTAIETEGGIDAEAETETETGN